jgi:cytochrome c
VRSILIAAVTVVSLSFSASAMADEALAKKSGCSKCHAMSTEETGPAYKEIAKKFKGKDEAAQMAAFKAVKDHGKVKTPDADVKTILGWIAKL